MINYFNSTKTERNYTEAYFKNYCLTSSSENPKKGWVASHIPESATPSHLFVKEPRLNSHRTPQAAETSKLRGGGVMRREQLVVSWSLSACHVPTMNLHYISFLLEYIISCRCCQCTGTVLVYLQCIVTKSPTFPTTIFVITTVPYFCSFTTSYNLHLQFI